jgi:SAM-dependent methyltransferase
MQQQMPEKESDLKLTPSEEKWSGYYASTCNNEKVEPIYDEAIKRLLRKYPAQKLRALELGAGTGTVTMLLAKESAKRVEMDQPPIHIVAEDQNCNALKIIQEKVEKHRLGQYVETRHRDMTKGMDIPDDLFDFIVARAVFPFLSLPAHLSMAMMVYESVTKKLVPGGCVVAEFFGDKHPWGVDAHQCATHTKEQVKNFFAHGYGEVAIKEHFTGEMPLAEGGTAVWHEFTVFAQRKLPANPDNLNEKAYDAGYLDCHSL